MTVENDGLPQSEAAAHQPNETERDRPPVTGGEAERPLDPPTEVLPLDAATATKLAAADAAARQAETDVPTAPEAPAPPPREPGTTTHGSLEGDLFDGRPGQ